MFEFRCWWFCTANLRTKILDVRGFESSRILISRGGIPSPNKKFPGNVESTNLSLENVSREIVWKTTQTSHARCLRCCISKRGEGTVD